MFLLLRVSLTLEHSIATYIKDIDPIQRIEARIARSREQHRQDVEHVQAHHPELAQVLTEFTEAFGRLEYRVTLKPFV